MDVESIMTRQVVTIDAAQTIRKALRLLEDLEIRHLPVLDDGDFVGMVSDRDLREYRLPVMEELTRPEYADKLLDTPVSRAMNTNLISLDRAESLASAIDLMLEYGVGAVPVMDRDTEELVGIVSYVDILRALRSSL